MKIAVMAAGGVGGYFGARRRPVEKTRAARIARGAQRPS